MSNSSLVNYTKISPNSNNPRSSGIRKITIHHCAGKVGVESLGSIFASASRQASANYGIGSDGRVGMYVEEKNRAWTSSNADNDQQAVTIEVANDGGAPDWHVSDAALGKLIELCVDICQRNGIERLNYTGDAGGNLTMHKWFAATTCPGAYLESKFPYIAEEVNRRLGEEKAPEGKETWYYPLSGTDTGRGEDMLVRYTKGRTGTNRYGFEVAIDRNAIAVTDPIYGEGNMEVPGGGGYVLSGHGEAGKWLYGAVKQGYLVAVYGETVKVQKACCRSLDGIDTGRGENQLIAYTKGRTGTNPYGFEVCIVEGEATSEPIYGNGNILVAEGTYVLSGHGEAGKWLYAHIQKGTKVTVNTQFGFIKIG